MLACLERWRGLGKEVQIPLDFMLIQSVHDIVFKDGPIACSKQKQGRRKVF